MSVQQEITLRQYPRFGEGPEHLYIAEHGEQMTSVMLPDEVWRQLGKPNDIVITVRDAWQPLGTMEIVAGKYLTSPQGERIGFHEDGTPQDDYPTGPIQRFEPYVPGPA